jgi:hypothetical protein
MYPICQAFLPKSLTWLILCVPQFPAERVSIQRMIDEFGWKPFRSISTAKLSNNKGYVMTRFNAMDITFSHAPLPGIKPADMAYWFSVIHKSTTVQYADGTKASIPNYQLFHPIDHILHTRTAETMNTRTLSLTWIEFPLAQCTIASRDSAGVPAFDCPNDRRGFLKNDPQSMWINAHQGNTTMKVTGWRNNTNDGLITFVFQVVRSGITVNPITVTHSWRNSPAGLVLTTTTLVGVNSAIGRVNTGGGKTANMLAIEGYCNGESTQDAVTRNIVHFVQEYGNLENVIPMVLKAKGGAVVVATGSKPPAASLVVEPAVAIASDEDMSAAATTVTVSENEPASLIDAQDSEGQHMDAVAAAAILEAHYAAEEGVQGAAQPAAAPHGEVDDVAVGH